MKRHEDAPLDAEERALAAQLRRLPPHGEPAPDLDARILAMARSAAGGRRAVPWYRGLPGYASAAAVCVLAAGLAWQLWPAHVQRGAGAKTSTPVPSSPKPAADVLPAQAQETAGTTEDSVADKAAADAAAVPLPKVMPAPRPPRPPAERPVPPTPQPPVASSANEASAYSAPEPAAPVRVMAPPPAPPAPPAPPPPAPVQSMQAAPAAATVEGTVKLREQPKPASAPVTVNAIRAKTADDTENGYDARPPATVQDSSVRYDWLKRIRELMAQGDRDGASSSLQEYKARYPDATIPADLQPLLTAPPAKSP